MASVFRLHDLQGLKSHGSLLLYYWVEENGVISNFAGSFPALF